MTTHNSDTASSQLLQGNQHMKITPELVREVADKFYALFLTEISIQNERVRNPRHSSPRPGGRR